MSSVCPAYAVTPQEGWFIAGEQTWSGKEYWIIDNKVNDADWNVSVRSVQTRFTGNLGVSSMGLAFYDFLNLTSTYQGFSSSPWYVDQDWVLRIKPISFQTSKDSITTDKDVSSDVYSNYLTDRVRLLVFDISTAPFMSRYYDPGTASVVKGRSEWFLDNRENSVFFDMRYAALPTISNSSLGEYQYYTLDDFHLPLPQFSPNDLYIGSFNASPKVVNINDLRITVVPNGGWLSTGGGAIYAQAQLAITYMCPKDKAPVGMSIGDRWPKQVPLEVEIENAYEAYYDKLLANGQIKDPSGVDAMFGDLNGQLGSSVNIDNPDVVSGFGEVFGWLSGFPLLTVIFPVIVAAILLPIFVKKGMS